MALYATESSDFLHRYGAEINRRQELPTRYRSNGMRTERPVGNTRYRNGGSSQNTARYSGSHLFYSGYDGLGSYAPYDSNLGAPTINVSTSTSRKAPAANYKDAPSLQNVYAPHKISSARLSQHESSSIFNNDFLHRGSINTDRVNSDRMYGADLNRFIDTKRYAPSNYRIPPSTWNTSRDNISDYEKFHRTPKTSLPYTALNNHAIYDTSNNSNYISEPRLYAAPHLQQRNSYLSSYLSDTSNGKQNKHLSNDRRNGHENIYPIPYRSGLEAKEHNGYRIKSFPSASLNNLNNADKLSYEKNNSYVKEISNDANGEDELEDDGYFAEGDPLTPAAAKQKYGKYLTAYEKEEILLYPEIYFVGKHAKKRQPSKNLLISGAKEYSFQGVNNMAKSGPVVAGYDDSQSGYIVVLNDHIAYRYEVIKLLGKGSFGQVVQARDHKTGEDVALKIIRSEDRFARQAKEEIRILQKLNEQDTENRHNIVRLLDNFKFREHVCMVFELLSSNLYELLHMNEFRGLQQAEVCTFTKGILECLELLFK
ncbi:unnamed protein product [Echinostoma caproni]|uniref:dual-specificity kinase n=1 Tax=Echinostoma caproni TaxID=27848 RepID=A0A183AWQ8_9TREM|nr:unnamed protein product [Echinostoma caproni]